MIAVGSMWRDAADYIDRTIAQYHELAAALAERGETCRFLWVESSSADDTYARLHESDLNHVLVKMDDDCPWFPSIDRPDRWRHLAWLSNGVLELVGPGDDKFIYVESDLQWDAATMLALLEHLERVEVVSPLTLRDGRYYDIWGSRGVDGVPFTVNPPYHRTLDTDGLVEVASIAGCTATRGVVARRTRFHPDDCYIGWNRDMRNAGIKVWCDPGLSVEHP